MGKTVSIDVEKFSSMLSDLIEVKLREREGQRVEEGASKMAADSTGTTESGAGKTGKAETPNRASKALKESYTIGGVDLKLDRISKRGTAYSNNNKMIITDEATGKRFYVWGALIAPCTSDEIPEGVSFFASVKA